MGDLLLAALITAALLVVAGWAVRGLTRYDAELGGHEPPPPPIRHAAICGAHGPHGFVCDLPPHNGYRHEQDGLGWIEFDAPRERPAYLNEKPPSPGVDRGLL